MWSLLRTVLLLALLAAASLQPARAAEYEAGPIWSNDDAEGKCPNVCSRAGLAWDGGWRTIAYSRSVCNCVGSSAIPPAYPVPPQYPPGYVGQPPVIRYDNTDFTFGDLPGGRSNARSFEDCANQCLAEPRCIAFTLSPARTCYKKSSTGNVQRVSGATSGFIAARGVAPPPLNAPPGAIPPAMPPTMAPPIAGANACSVGGTNKCPGCSVSCGPDQRPVCTSPIDGVAGMCQRDAWCRCAPR